MTKQRFFTGCLLLGIIGTGYGLYRIYGNWKLLQVGERVDARMTYLETKLDTPDQKIESWDQADEHSQSSYQTIIFRTQSGQRIVWQSPISSISGFSSDDTMTYAIIPPDQTIEVLYDPADPENFSYSSLSALWLQWFIMIVIGVLLISLPLGLFDAVVNRLTASERQPQDDPAMFSSMR